MLWYQDEFLKTTQVLSVLLLILGKLSLAALILWKLSSAVEEKLKLSDY